MKPLWNHPALPNRSLSQFSNKIPAKLNECTKVGGIKKGKHCTKCWPTKSTQSICSVAKTNNRIGGKLPNKHQLNYMLRYKRRLSHAHLAFAESIAQHAHSQATTFCALWLSHRRYSVEDAWDSPRGTSQLQASKEVNATPWHQRNIHPSSTEITSPSFVKQEEINVSYPTSLTFTEHTKLESCNPIIFSIHIGEVPANLLRASETGGSSSKDLGVAPC